MYCSREIFDNNFAKIQQRWMSLIERPAPMDQQEFNKLCHETLPKIMDFHAIENPKVENFLKMLGGFRFSDPDLKESAEALVFVEKWSSPVPLALLSGKLVPRNVNKFMLTYEAKLLAEEDIVIQARIESLMNLFQTRNNEDVTQMVLNALETYKKLIVCDTSWQNKVTGTTLESLIKSLLIVTCHRKEFEHLNSLIKFHPLHRKVQLLINEIKANPSVQHIKECRLFICAAIAQDLLKSEFDLPREQQNIENFNLYVNLIIDLAIKERKFEENLSKILLCANEMNVNSEFYYLTANLLRLKMPNRQEPLVIRLISIGLSHDLSFLEQIKYTKEGSTQKWSENDFIEVYRKMFTALTTLGFIIKDYSLRRLCLQAASVCEPSTSFCKEILKTLPAASESMVKLEENPEREAALLCVREQLEIFQSAIRADVNLSSTWEISTIACYEKLDFFNRRKMLSDDLEPLHYPGVEKYLKRSRKDSTEEEEKKEKKPLNAQKILEESRQFTADISARLKRLKNPFHVDGVAIPFAPSDIKAIIVKSLENSQDFEVADSGEIFNKLSLPLEKFSSYHSHFQAMNSHQKKRNKRHLRFDFEKHEGSSLSVAEMYQEGVVNIQDLCNRGCNIFDIENVMLFAITEKKMLYMQQEFVDLNMNQDVDVTKSQMQATTNYVICRQIPEYTRYMRCVNIGFTNSSIIEFCAENYVFEAVPGHYKFNRKNTGEASNEGRTQVREHSEGQERIKPKPRSKPKPVEEEKEKLPKPMIQRRGPPVVLQSHLESFEASEELLKVFRQMEHQLSLLASTQIPNTVVKLNLRQMQNTNSKHKVDFTYASSSQMLVKLQKQRNNKVDLLQVVSMDMQARIHGSLAVTLEINDGIIYDDNNEPHIKTTMDFKLSGALTFDHVSHVIKLMDVECIIGSSKSSFKCSFRAGSRSWDKKPRKNKPEMSDGEVINGRSGSDGDVDRPHQPPVNGEAQQTQQVPPTQQVSQSPMRQAPVQVVNPMSFSHIPAQSPPFTKSVTQIIPTTSHEYRGDGAVVSQPQFYTQSMTVFESQTVPHQDSAPQRQRIKSENVNIISVEGISPKLSFSDPITSLFMTTNGSDNHETATGVQYPQLPVKTEIKIEPIVESKGASTAIDFEDEVPAAQVVKFKPTEPTAIMKNPPVTTPPTSPPPLNCKKPTELEEKPKIIKEESKKVLNPFNVLQNSNRAPSSDRVVNNLHETSCNSHLKIENSVIMKPKMRKFSDTSSSAERILSNTPPADVIDLTDETIDVTNGFSSQEKQLKDPLGFDFVDCDGSKIFTRGIDIHANNLNKEYSRVMKKIGIKKSAPKQIKRPRESISDDDDSMNSFEKVTPVIKKGSVVLVDVMELMKDVERYKALMVVHATPVTPIITSKLRPFAKTRRDFLLTSNDVEQPIENEEEFVSDITQSTFHIAYNIPKSKTNGWSS